MPKQKKEMLRDELPALTRLLAEITRHKEHERVQPRLPFETPATAANSPLGRLGEKPTKPRRSRDNPVAARSKISGKELF